ncbi:hypothetical protein ACWCRI_41690, partial [Streptomyces collinus]
MVVMLLVDLDPELAALRPLGGFFVLRTTAGARRPPGALPPTHFVIADQARMRWDLQPLQEWDEIAV